MDSLHWHAPSVHLPTIKARAMKFDRFIQILLPHDEKFYTFFEESAQNLVDAGQLLVEFSRSAPSAREGIVERMHELEHQGDSVTHKIFAELSSTFVTPFEGRTQFGEDLVRNRV